MSHGSPQFSAGIDGWTGREAADAMEAMMLAGGAGAFADEVDAPMGLGMGRIDENVTGRLAGSMPGGDAMQATLQSPFAFAHPSLSPNRAPRGPGTRARLAPSAAGRSPDGAAGSIVGVDAVEGVVFDVEEVRDSLIVAAMSERLGMGGVGVQSSLSPAPIGIMRARGQRSDPGANIVPPAYEALARSGALSGYAFAAVPPRFAGMGEPGMGAGGDAGRRRPSSPSGDSQAADGWAGVSRRDDLGESFAERASPQRSHAAMRLLSPEMDPSSLALPADGRVTLQLTGPQRVKARRLTGNERILATEDVVAGVPMHVAEDKQARMTEQQLRQSTRLRRKAAEAALQAEQAETRRRRAREARLKAKADAAARLSAASSASRSGSGSGSGAGAGASAAAAAAPAPWRAGGSMNSRAPPDALGIGSVPAGSTSPSRGRSSAQLARQQAQQEAARSAANPSSTGGADGSVPRGMPRQPRPELSPLRARPAPAVASHIRRSQRLRAEMEEARAELGAAMALTEGSGTLDAPPPSEGLSRLISSSDEWARTRAADAMARRAAIEDERRRRAEEDAMASRRRKPPPRRKKRGASSSKRPPRPRDGQEGKGAEGDSDADARAAESDAVVSPPPPRFAGDGTASVTSLEPGESPAFRGGAASALDGRDGAAVLADARAKARASTGETGHPATFTGSARRSEGAGGAREEHFGAKAHAGGSRRGRRGVGSSTASLPAMSSSQSAQVYAEPQRLAPAALVSSGAQWEAARLKARPRGRRNKGAAVATGSASLLPAMSRAAASGMDPGASGRSGTQGPRERLSSTMGATSTRGRGAAGDRARQRGQDVERWGQTRAEAGRAGGGPAPRQRPGGAVEEAAARAARAEGRDATAALDAAEAAAVIAAATPAADRAVIDKGLDRVAAGSGADVPVRAGSAVPAGLIDAESLDAALAERSLTGIGRRVRGSSSGAAGAESLSGPRARGGSAQGRAGTPPRGARRPSRHEASVREAAALFEEASMLAEGGFAAPMRRMSSGTRPGTSSSSRPRSRGRAGSPIVGGMRPTTPVDYSLGPGAAATNPGIRADRFAADARARAERPDIPDSKRVRPWAAAQAEATASAKAEAARAADPAYQRAVAERVTREALRDVEHASEAGQPRGSGSHAGDDVVADDVDLLAGGSSGALDLVAPPE